MLTFLLAGVFLTNVVSDIMRKKNSRTFSLSGVTGALFYVFETSLFALFYFWAFNGFKLYFNASVILYGFVYGVIVITTLVPSIFVYRYASFSFVTFVSGSAGLILSLVTGALIFDETISADKLLRVGLMLVATLVIFVGNRKAAGQQKSDGKAREGEAGKRLSLALLLILIGAVLGAGSNVVMKLYSADPTVTDQNSFFFATNIFSALLVLPVIPFTMRRDKVKFADLLQMVKSKKTLYSAITTANSNVSSILRIMILASMDVSVFSLPISSAMSFAAVAIATPIIGERLNKYTLISTAIAILSVVLPFLIA